MTRRNLLGNLAALLAAHPLLVLAAKSHIGKNNVSAVTDQVGTSQPDALEFVNHYHLQWIELRKVPGTNKEFAALTAPELKGYAAELRENKLKVSVLHTDSPKPEAIDAALILGAGKLLVPSGIVIVASPEARALTPAGLDWDPAKSPEHPSKDRMLNVRIRSLETLNWRAILEALERDNYRGGICLETTPDKADDAMRELMHFIGEL